MKTNLLSLCLVALQITCLAQDNGNSNDNRQWWRSYTGESITDGRDRRLEFSGIGQGAEHLEGTFYLIRLNRRSYPIVLIKGHLNKAGEFTANVSLEVSNQENGKWKEVESSLSKKVDVTLTAGRHIDKLSIQIQLDALQPYIGTFKFGRISLQTGERAVIPLIWLTEQGQ